MKSQKGFSIVEGLLILIIIGLVGGTGWYVYSSSNKANDSLSNADNNDSSATKIAGNNEVMTKTCELPAGWKQYENATYKHSFYYPEDFKAEEIVELGGTYGDLVSDPEDSKNIIFTLNVLLWPDGSTVGNANGDEDALKKALSEGGAKNVAQLSQKINKEDDNPYIKNKSVGELVEFDICKGDAWGFDVTEGFTSGFAGVTGGHILDEKTTVVFVSDDKSIYQIEYPTSNKNFAKILSSLKLQ